MYLIRGLCHRTDITMSCHGFQIDLSPEWRAKVAKCQRLSPGEGQKAVNQLIETSGKHWLQCSGWEREVWSPRDIRVAWGEWGPEHISVPGNACGLDITRDNFGCIFPDGRSLEPHNIDSLAQKYLLLIVFTEIAESVQYGI